MLSRDGHNRSIRKRCKIVTLIYRRKPKVVGKGEFSDLELGDSRLPLTCLRFLTPPLFNPSSSLTRLCFLHASASYTPLPLTQPSLLKRTE